WWTRMPTATCWAKSWSPARPWRRWNRSTAAPRSCCLLSSGVGSREWGVGKCVLKPVRKHPDSPLPTPERKIMHWRSPDSLPEAVDLIEHLEIPLPDGQRLAARVWLPQSARERPLPAILEYLPYRKRDLTRRRDDMNHGWCAGHGYVCVRLDMRGSGEADGVLRDQYREQELDDAVFAIEWIARQPWCDGRVGMMGISWGGFNALQVASLRPPALKAVISANSTDDLYRDNMHYMGG